MMFETLIFLAAASQSAPGAVGCERSATISAAAVANPGIVEMTYNAFVAVEETPALSEITRPAVADVPAKQPAMAVSAGTAWIS